MRDLNFQSLYRLTVFLFFATLLVYIMIVGQGVIVPLLIAFFIAFLLIPFNNLLERIRFPRMLAAITSLVVAIVVIAGLFTLFGSQIQKFSSDFDQISERVEELKSRLPPFVSEKLESFSVDDITTYISENTGALFARLGSFIGSFTLVVVVPIYIVLILLFRDQLKEFVARVFKTRQEEKSENPERKNPTQVEAHHSSEKSTDVQILIPKIRSVVQKYITGMFYVMCILFVLYSAALISLGIEHALLFAALAAVLNIIPFVGPFLGSALPIVFALLTKDSLFYPVAVLGAFMIIQTLEGNVITPNIVGNNVSLNPLVSLLALFVGASIWGVAGMILFIPMVAILKEIFQTIDGLEPYAYLLGNGDPKPKKNGFMEKAVKKVKDRLS